MSEWLTRLREVSVKFGPRVDDQTILIVKQAR